VGRNDGREKFKEINCGGRTTRSADPRLPEGAAATYLKIQIASWVRQLGSIRRPPLTNAGAATPVESTVLGAKSPRAMWVMEEMRIIAPDRIGG